MGQQHRLVQPGLKGQAGAVIAGAALQADPAAGRAVFPTSGPMFKPTLPG
jgi:hypothetical protein